MEEQALFPEVQARLQQEIRSRPDRVLEIDLAALSRTYLSHLQELVARSLEKAGEYLRFTSYLVYLKSRLLLPREESPPEETEETPNSFLIEKAAGGWGRIFEFYAWLERDVFCAPSPCPPEPPLEGNLEALITAFLRVLERSAPPSLELPRLEPLFERFLPLVKKEILRRKRILFSELASPYPGRQERLVLFLVLLELSFREFCRLLQNLPWGEIEILLRREEL